MRQFLFRKFAAIATIAAPAVYFRNSLHFQTYLEPETASVPETKQAPIVIDDDDDEDDAEWMAEKEKCSFCKQFLQSPCKIPFRKWSKCVDKAKEENLEFIGACFQYTGALIECTNENHDYFTRMSDYSDDEEVEEEQNGASVTEPVAEEKEDGRDPSEGHIVKDNSEHKKIPM